MLNPPFCDNVQKSVHEAQSSLIWIYTVQPLVFDFSMWYNFYEIHLTLLHSERPKLYAILAFLSAVGLKDLQTIFFICLFDK